MFDLQGGESRVEKDELFINGCRLLHSLESEIAAAEVSQREGRGGTKIPLNVAKSVQPPATLAHTAFINPLCCPRGQREDMGLSPATQVDSSALSSRTGSHFLHHGQDQLSVALVETYGITANLAEEADFVVAQLR